MLRNNMELASQKTTESRLASIRETLIDYLRSHRRLPCPDVMADSVGFDGYEDLDAETGACRHPVGVLPYITLSIARNAVIDGWGHFFTYHVSNLSYTDSDCGRSHDWTRVTTLREGLEGELHVGGNSAPQCNVLVVVSHGPNGDGAFSVDGYRNAMGDAGPLEIKNADGDYDYENRDFNGDATNYFDDVVLAMSPGELLAPLIKDGTVRSDSLVRADWFVQMRHSLSRYLFSAFSGALCAFPATLTGLGLPNNFVVNPWNYTLSFPDVTTPVVVSTPNTDRIFHVVLDAGDPSTTESNLEVTLTKQEAIHVFTDAGKTAPPCLNDRYEVVAAQFSAIRHALIGHISTFSGELCAFPLTLADLNLPSATIKDPWTSPPSDFAYASIPVDQNTPTSAVMVTVSASVGGHAIAITKGEAIGYFGTSFGPLPDCLR